MKKTLLILALGALASSCNNAVSSSSIEGQITLTDALGRNVTLVPGEAERIVCIGAGALRLYSYIGDQDRLARSWGRWQIRLLELPLCFKALPKGLRIQLGRSPLLRHGRAQGPGR